MTKQIEAELQVTVNSKVLQFVSTKELVKELTKREGVKTKTVNFEEKIYFNVSGPCILLEVID
jgi:hypothetical protein